MQSKKILLAIISLGLIFAPSLFAQDMTEFQRQMMEKMRQQTMQKTMQKTQSGQAQGGQAQGGETQPPGFAAIHLSGEGQKLFNDPALGTNGKSCGSCHQEGRKPLDGRKVDHRLVAYVQYCYEHAIGGKKVIEENKVEQLMAYFNSLEKKPNPAGAIAPTPMMPSPKMSSPMRPNAPSVQGGEEDW